MRITGGSFSGHALSAPRGLSTRPTADKVRLALFHTLLPGGGSAEGLQVLDLFAGTGALGLEALSRGAARAVFVESAQPAAQAIAANLRALDLSGRAELLVTRVERALPQLRGPFDWIFADPPYAAGALRPLLDALGAPGCPLLHEGSLVVVEHALLARAPEPVDARHGGLTRVDRRCYGQTALSFYGFTGAP